MEQAARRVRRLDTMRFTTEKARTKLARVYPGTKKSKPM